MTETKTTISNPSIYIEKNYQINHIIKIKLILTENSLGIVLIVTTTTHIQVQINVLLATYLSSLRHLGW